MNDNPLQSKGRNDLLKKALLTVFFVLITVATIWVVTTQSRDFSAGGFWQFLSSANPLWLIAAILAASGFIFFEAASLHEICRGFGHRQKFRRSLVYSASDIYFSAITPSATGGQPASGYFMAHDGIPVPVTTVALLLNLIMYTMSIVVIGVVCFVFRPSLFLHFSVLSKWLIIIGCVMQILMAVFFLLLLRHEKIVLKISRVFLSLLHRLHLVRHAKRKSEKLARMAEEFRVCAGMLKGRRWILVISFLFNFLQRFSLIMVPVFAYLAVGGSPARAFDVFVVQSMVILGSNSVPIPGAVGVADYLLIDGFSALVPNAVNMELFSRGLSFYFSVAISAVYTFICYLLLVKKMKRNVLK